MRSHRRAALLVAAATAFTLFSNSPVDASAATVTVTPSATRAGWWVYSGFSSAPTCGSFVRSHFPGADYWCWSSNGGPWSVTVPHRIE